MIVRKLRLKKGWSQEQLAEFTGLSVRTIQRIERGQEASLESLKSLAAVFEVEINDLKQENSMPTSNPISEDEKLALESVRDIKGFYTHLIKYIVIMTVLFFVAYSEHHVASWFKWVALGWGLGLLSHALNAFEVFNIFGPKWEKSQVEKRLGKKLD